MNFEDYQTECLKTWNEQEPQLANAALGLVGEYWEWQEHDLTEKSKHLDEFGDFLYYQAILYHLLGLDRTSGVKLYETEAPIRAHGPISVMAERVKKIVYHDRDIEEWHWSPVTARLDSWIHQECKTMDIDEFRQRKKNVEKLSTRHSDGSFNPNHGVENE